MKAKRIIALILTAVMLISLVACSNSSGKGSVYWLNFKPELDATLQQLAKKYTEKTGVKVKIKTPESGTYQQTLLDEMNSDDPPTLFVVNDQHGADEWGDEIFDLSDTNVKSQLKNQRYNITDEEGNILAIPYCIECYGIVVNPGMVSEAGFSVDDIKNFGTLKTVVKYIHQNSGKLGFDAFCSPDLDAESSWRVTGHLANIEYCYEDRAADSWKECPASLTGEYMPYFKNLYDLCINNSVSDPTELAAGGHNPVEEFTSGKAAFLLTGSWDYAVLSKAVPDVTIIPYYCGVKGEEKASLNSGSENYWAVNGGTPIADRDATLDFMEWLVSDPEASSLMVEQLGNLPYRSAKEASNGFLIKQEEYLKKGCYKMNWSMTFQPDVVNYRADIVKALSAYNADQSDANWKKVKEAMIDGWAKHYAAVHN